MNEVHRHHVTTARNLDLNADAYMASGVYALALYPIDATTLFLKPSSGTAKAVIDERS